MKRVLITGAAGVIGRCLRAGLKGVYDELRLADIALQEPAGPGETVLRTDIRDIAALEAAMQSVDCVVHLAGIPVEGPWETVRDLNIDGCYNAFEAAYQAGVPKMIFASSGQTTLMHGRNIPVGPESPVRPYTVYACTKVFGEALARYYVDVRGMKVLVLRIGWFRAYDDPMLRDPAHPVQKEWCSPRDLTQLITRAVRADLSFGIFYGVSNNTGRYWDIRNARELLGYQPEDDAARILARSLAMTPP